MGRSNRGGSGEGVGREVDLVPPEPEGFESGEMNGDEEIGEGGTDIGWNPSVRLALFSIDGIGMERLDELGMSSRFGYGLVWALDRLGPDTILIDGEETE